MSNKDNLNAIEYAKAIYELAIEENKVNVIYNQLLELETLFYDDFDFLYWFQTIANDNEEKIKCFKICISSYLHWIFNNFFYYLIRKNDEHLILKIFNNLDTMLCAELDIIRVKITTPFNLEEKYIKKIEEIIIKKTKKNVRTSIKIDPSLIGGIRIEYNDKYYDNSIKSKLTDIKNHLKGEI